VRASQNASRARGGGVDHGHHITPHPFRVEGGDVREPLRPGGTAASGDRKLVGSITSGTADLPSIERIIYENKRRYSR
jgi:hypothetical protein